MRGYLVPAHNKELFEGIIRNVSIAANLASISLVAGTATPLYNLCTCSCCVLHSGIYVAAIPSRPVKNSSTTIITKLQRMFYPVLEYPDGGGGANALFLAFLNHFISNIDLINELIFNRQMLEFIQKKFDEDPDKQILLEGYRETNTGIFSEIFKDGIFPSSMLSMQYTQPMVKYYESQNLSTERISELMKKFTYYFDVISYNKIKQSDFALSDSFLDIVKSFFAKFPDNVYGPNSYNDFIRFQRQHISPERIKPAPIFLADKNDTSTQ